MAADDRDAPSAPEHGGVSSPHACLSAFNVSGGPDLSGPGISMVRGRPGKGAILQHVVRLRRPEAGFIARNGEGCSDAGLQTPCP